MINVKLKKIILNLSIISICIIPLNTLAYAHYVIPGGETIGIEVHSKGILVVGFYEVNNKLIGKESGFKIGDMITKVNNKNVSTINEMVDILNTGDKKVAFNVLRSNTNYTINMNLVNVDDIYKTGLLIKDKINGIGTLSYIDVSGKNNTFASLGHEIISSETSTKFEIKDGTIYDANVTSITKSSDGNAGEKNATYNKEKVEGLITNNELTGIYGDYYGEINESKKVAVAEPDEITLGEATMLTVIENNSVVENKIEIIGLDKESKTKNILFEIKDNDMLNKTGGIVQGMSGSPILQNKKIIGAVNYVIVSDTSKGYGIYITTMLKESEDLNN